MMIILSNKRYYKENNVILKLYVKIENYLFLFKTNLFSINYKIVIDIIIRFAIFINSFYL